MEDSCDFAILGSTPLCHLLAGLLATEHGKRVCLIGTPWSPFHLPRRFDLSAGPVTRPESWAMLAQGTAETLKLLAGVGKGLFEYVDPLFIGEAPASIEMLGHMRHVAAGLGQAAERVTDSRIVATGSGCRIRDAAMLVPGRIEPALEAWVDGQGVQRLPASETRTTIRRDGSVLLERDGVTQEARRAVLADDTAIGQQLAPEAFEGILEVRPTTSIVTEPARPLPAPFVHYLDRGVTLGQQRGRGPVTAIATDRADLLPRIGSCLSAQAPLLRAGQSSFERLDSVNGAPVVAALGGVRATVFAGLGVGGAFLAPALARLLAGTAGDAEEAFFAARGTSRGNKRQQVADWTDLARPGLAA